MHMAAQVAEWVRALEEYDGPRHVDVPCTMVRPATLLTMHAAHNQMCGRTSIVCKFVCITIRMFLSTPIGCTKLPT